MYPYEYYNALDNIKPQIKLVKECRGHGTKFQKAFQNLLESVITIKGHAWCMDVVSERRKMAKLMAGEFIKYIK